MYSPEDNRCVSSVSRQSPQNLHKRNIGIKMNWRKAETLYNNMREAIQKKNYQQMRTIIRNPDYDPNRVGAGDKRTALHTAAHEDDREALAILLRQRGINPNVRTTKGLTPFLLAASEGKMVSFEVLLNDSRVDADERDDEDHTAMELVKSLGRVVKVNKAKELLAKQTNSHHNPKDSVKLAILIGNSKYPAPADSMTWPWEDLPGVKKDIADMEARLKADGYRVEVVENSENILETVKEVMNKTPVSSVTDLQVLYAGGQLRSKKTPS